MTSFALALASALAWGSGDFLSGLMSRRQAVLGVLLVSQGVGLPLMTVAVLLHGGLPTHWREAVPYGLLAAVASQIGLAALFRGMAVGNISIVAPISATSAVLPVLEGLLEGDRPTVVQIAGVVLALAGVALASRPAAPRHDAAAARRAAHGASHGRGHVAVDAAFGGLAAFGFGLVYIALHRASGEDPFWPVLVQRAGALPLLIAAVMATRRPLATLSMPWRSVGVLIISGALDVSANVLYAAASVSGLGGLAAVIGSLYPVVTIALATVFLHERLAPPQAIGVGGALAGVALIALH